MTENIDVLIDGAIGYEDVSLKSYQIKAIHQEGKKWKTKFEKAGIKFD